MIDSVTLNCTARGVKKALDRIKMLQSYLAAAKTQIRATTFDHPAATTIFRAEMELAGISGTLIAISGWLESDCKERPK